jgi:hypothetical protein
MVAERGRPIQDARFLKVNMMQCYNIPNCSTAVTQHFTSHHLENPVLGNTRFPPYFKVPSLHFTSLHFTSLYTIDGLSMSRIVQNTKQMIHIKITNSDINIAEVVMKVYRHTNTTYVEDQKLWNCNSGKHL